MQDANVNANASDHDLLIRLDQKVDSFLSGQLNINNTMSDHESRIRALEKDSDLHKGSERNTRLWFGILISLIGIVEPVVMFVLAQHK